MKHLGTHEFPQKILSNEIDNQNITIANKLNLPFHKDLIDPSFGDIFTSNNAIKFINNESNEVTLLDINNPDVLKSIIVSEIMFDNFFNYSEEYETSNSFNNEILLNNNLLQNIVEITTDSTIYIDSVNNFNIIELTFLDETSAIEVNNNLIAYLTSDLPLLFNFININDSTSIEYMAIITNIELLNNKIFLNIKNTSWFNTILTSTQVQINTFKFINVIINENCVKLPLHLHTIEQLEDLPTHTNCINGYVKLNSNNLKFDMDQNLQLSTGKLFNTLFEKKQLDQLQQETKFISNIQNVIDTQIKFVSTEINLGGDTTVIEYDTTSIDINLENSLKIFTKNGWQINFDTNTIISDMTNFNDKFLVEKIEFDFAQIFGITNIVDATNLINVKYEQINKIDVNNLIPYSVAEQKHTAISGYYDINIIQPNINTIPSAINIFSPICKDIENNIFFNKIIEYNNLSTTFILNLIDNKTLHLTFTDSTSSTLEISILQYDYFTSTWLVRLGNINVPMNITLETGMYKIIPTTNANTYNLKLY